MRGKEIERKKMNKRENKEKNVLFFYMFGWKENKSCIKMTYISLLQ